MINNFAARFKLLLKKKRNHITKIAGNEKDISTFEYKKEKQAWLQVQDGNSGRKKCDREQKGKGQKKIIRFWRKKSQKIMTNPMRHGE